MPNELVPYQDIEKMGKAVATSGLFGVKNEAQAVALMLIAQAYGKHPALAAMEYNIINNRPSKKSEAMLASFQEAGGKVKWIELTDKKAKAEFSHPQGGVLELEWTIEMAQKAGLVEKEYSNYKKYPRAMLRSRVVAEGVRAVYPAATGGMLSKEEAEDIEDNNTKQDPNKSRLENIIDAESTVKEDVKDAPPPDKEEPETKKVSDNKTTKSKKSTKNNVTDSNTINTLPEGHKEIIGLIDNKVQGDGGEIICYKKSTNPILNPANGKNEIKHSFLIDDKRYGTFDYEIAKGLLECVDKRILVKIEYKERVSGDKTFNDIVSFSQATTDDVPI